MIHAGRGAATVERDRFTWPTPPPGVVGWPLGPRMGGRFDLAHKSSAGTVSAVANGWLSGCLDPTGRFFYAAPFAATTVLKYDIANDRFTTFGSLGAGNKWSRTILAPTGLIYGIPYATTSFCRIDPASDTVTTFGTASAAALIGGACLGPDGCIYMPPGSNTAVTVLDPTNEYVSSFGSMGAAANKWGDPILARNGMIYAPTAAATQVLKIDPQQKTAVAIGATVSAGYSSFATAPSGTIYAAPYGAFGTVLRVDPSTDTVTQFGSLGATVNKYNPSVVTAPNGRLYAAPYAATALLELDPVTDTLTTFGTPPANSELGQGQLLPDGRIVWLPRNKTVALIAGGDTSPVPLQHSLGYR